MAGNIDWEAGRKRLMIQPSTWCISDPEERLAAAKEDFVRAGFVHEAQVLTAVRLDTALYKLPVSEQEEYKASRKRSKAAKKRALQQGQVLEGGDGVKKIKAHGIKREGDVAVATSAALLASTVPYEGNCGVEEPSFSVVTFVEEMADSSTYSQPMSGGVFMAANGDAAKSVLVVRVSVAGTACDVGKPEKIDNYTVQIPVTRSNQTDFIGDKEADARSRVDAEVSAMFGGHVTYEVLNFAFKRMVPEHERWTVAATIKPPFMFGDINGSVSYAGNHDDDILILFPVVVQSEGPK